MDKDRVGTGALARPAEQSSAAHSADADSSGIRGRGRPRHTDWLRYSAAMLMMVIREIFDESSYSRFLSRTQMPSSPQAYAAFRREHEALKARRPRCC